MDRSIVWWRALVLTAVATCLVLALSASGQGGKSGAVFATLDIRKVTSDSKSWQAAQTDFAAKRGRYDARITRRRSMPFMADAEHEELDKLTEKDPAQATATEKARVDELTKKGQAQVQDFQTRQMKPEKDLSDADKAKLQQDAATASQSEQKAAALGDKLANELREADSQATADFTKKIRTATQKVAEGKGISIVFDMQVAWYAGTDITTAVVNELNKQ